MYLGTGYGNNISQVIIFLEFKYWLCLCLLFNKSLQPLLSLTVNPAWAKKGWLFYCPQQKVYFGGLLLKSIYLVGCDSFQQLLQQVWAVGWRNRWVDSRCVSEPANQEPQEKKPQPCQEIPRKNEWEVQNELRDRVHLLVCVLELSTTSHGISQPMEFV